MNVSAQFRRYLDELELLAKNVRDVLPMLKTGEQRDWAIETLEKHLSYVQAASQAPSVTKESKP